MARQVEARMSSTTERVSHRRFRWTRDGRLRAPVELFHRLPQDHLGAVDVHRVWMIVAAIEMKALKLWSVLQERMAIPLFSFNLPK